METPSTAENPGTLTLWERMPTGCVLLRMPLLSAAVHSRRRVAGRREGEVASDNDRTSFHSTALVCFRGSLSSLTSMKQY